MVYLRLGTDAYHMALWKLCLIDSTGSASFLSRRSMHGSPTACSIHFGILIRQIVNPDGTDSRPSGSSRLSQNMIWINNILPLGFQGVGFLEINESGIDMAKGPGPNWTYQRVMPERSRSLQDSISVKEEKDRSRRDKTPGDT